MKQIKTLAVVALVCILGLTACKQHPVAVSPLSTPASHIPIETLTSETPTLTVTVTPTPTGMPTLTPTVIPTRTPLPTPTPGGSVWQIIFSGCPCTPTLSSCTGGDCTANIYEVNSNGTDLRQIVGGEIGAHSPSPSPDGRYLAFVDEREDVSVTPTPEERGHGGLVYPRTYLFDFTTGKIMPLGTKRFTRCQWFTDGMRLACYADGDIYIVSLDGADPIQAASIAPGTQLCAFDLSPDGEHIVYLEENPALSEPRDLNIYRVDVDGTGLFHLATLPAISYCGSVQWSPNGEQVFVTVSYNSVVSASDLFLVGVEGGEVNSIFHSNYHIFTTPRWLADGQHIFFVEYNRERDTNVFYIVDRNRVVRTFEISGLGGSILAGDLSPDQTQFVFAVRGLYMADLETGYWAPILADYQVGFDGIATLVVSDWR
jgi:Tol biopolymer transport system component